MSKLRLILSLILSLIIIVSACIGIVYLSMPPLQMLCTIVALIGSLYFQMLYKNLKKL